MKVEKLYDIVEAHFGYRGEMSYMDRKGKEVGCILYNAFLFKCNIDDPYEQFSGGIILGDDGQLLTEFLGKECSLDSDEESIKESLQVIDDYCRMRLPDKFLEAYDKAYKGK